MDSETDHPSTALEMASVPHQILLISSDSAMTSQLQQLLSEFSDPSQVANTECPSIQLDTAVSIEQADQQLQRKKYQALLLEISLFQAFHAYRHNPATHSSEESNNDVPVITLSQTHNTQLATHALQGGAWGYLLMTQLDAPTVFYSLQCAIQQHQQWHHQLQSLALAQHQQRQTNQAQEMESWEQWAKPAGAPSLTAQLFDAGPLRETLPDLFRELVEEYGQALDSALERRAYRVQPSKEKPLKALSEQLGFLKATPRDVVEIHTHALRGKTLGALPEKANAYIAESRLVVLEVMGDLVTYYRRYFLGLSKGVKKRRP